MYYSKIEDGGTGFTNQIFSLISSIILAYKKGDKVVIVDNFLNNVYQQNYTPISNIIDIYKINLFLQQYYGIIIIDR